jgi:hypothetical protein
VILFILGFFVGIVTCPFFIAYGLKHPKKHAYLPRGSVFVAYELAKRKRYNKH